jgi:L-ascorbate metabolism protein UlaG (beta-lactamase superfamily)
MTVCYYSVMKITKFGHCCLLLEINGVRLLTDPGTMSTGENTATGIDAIIITHEHADHFHIDSVKKILSNNPNAITVTNASVGALLAKANISFTKVEDGESIQVKEITIAGFGREHAEIYGPITVVNTGFMIANKFFFPGDNFYNPQVPVDVLALPMAGPWMKFSEAIDYAKAVKPRTAFPVHDGIYMPEFANEFNARMGSMFLSPAGIEFVSLTAGETKEF